MAYLGVFLFGGLAVFTVAAWWRLRARDQKTLAEWDKREQDLAGAPDAFHWEDHVEDADAWKGEDDRDP